MIIKSIVITNIRAIETREVVFSENINVIQGDNRVGKTTIVYSILYALGGLNAVPVSAEEFYRKGASRCSVVLSFQVDGIDYEVYRSKSNCKLDIIEDEKVRTVAVGLKIVSKAMQKLLGIDNFSFYLINPKTMIQGVDVGFIEETIQNMLSYTDTTRYIERLQKEVLELSDTLAQTKDMVVPDLDVIAQHKEDTLKHKDALARYKQFQDYQDLSHMPTHTVIGNSTHALSIIEELDGIIACVKEYQTTQKSLDHLHAKVETLTEQLSDYAEDGGKDKLLTLNMQLEDTKRNRFLKRQQLEVIDLHKQFTDRLGKDELDNFLAYLETYKDEGINLPDVCSRYNQDGLIAAIELLTAQKTEYEDTIAQWKEYERVTKALSDLPKSYNTYLKIEDALTALKLHKEFMSGVCPTCKKPHNEDEYQQLKQKIEGVTPPSYTETELNKFKRVLDQLGSDVSPTKPTEPYPDLEGTLQAINNAEQKLSDLEGLKLSIAEYYLDSDSQYREELDLSKDYNRLASWLESEIGREESVITQMTVISNTIDKINQEIRRLNESVAFDSPVKEKHLAEGGLAALERERGEASVAYTNWINLETATEKNAMILDNMDLPVGVNIQKYRETLLETVENSHTYDYEQEMKDYHKALAVNKKNEALRNDYTDKKNRLNHFKDCKASADKSVWTLLLGTANKFISLMTEGEMSHIYTEGRNIMYTEAIGNAYRKASMRGASDMERCILIFGLILSYRELNGVEMPIIMDEAIASMSRVNRDKFIALIRKSGIQTLVVTLQDITTEEADNVINLLR